ncbi:MAG TPA: hypothetical protein VKT78_01610, partial [Fimbriimonadaceae bacterium]|nr:hypothetical protein [Fimbriimonadaceae bacterium]
MRIVAIFSLVLACALASANLNALILIAPGVAKPKLDPALTGQRLAVLWPPDFGRPESLGHNRLLSLMSGADWRGDQSDAAFLPPPTGTRGFAAAHYESLKDRGYLARRSSWLNGEPVYAVSSPVGVGSAKPDALLMALSEDSPTVEPVPYAGPWPTSGLLVFEADSWDTAADIAQRVGGRALVVELPKVQYTTASSFYLMGRDWPEGNGAGLPVDRSTGVAGLVRARNALTLVLHPESIEWRDQPDAHDVPFRWFPFVREGGFLLLVAGMTMMAGVIGLATYAISLEKRGALAAALLVAASLVPATLLMAGSLDRRFGLDYDPGWILLAWALLTAATGAVQALSRVAFPGTHSLFAPALVGLLAMVFGDPKWSILSGLFGYNGTASSPEAAGALLAYLTGVVAFSRRSNLAAAWLGRAAVAATLAVGLVGGGWWAAEPAQAILLPAIALVAGEGWMRWPWLIILALVPNGRVDVVHQGFAWSPLGCLTSARGISAVNLFDYAIFAVYPGLFAIGLIALYVSVFGGGFVMRQFRVAFRQDAR